MSAVKPVGTGKKIADPADAGQPLDEPIQLTTEDRIEIGRAHV